jgi:hypothetical protein
MDKKIFLRNAIVFDFDGTLIKNGKYNNDKSIHIMYASWVSCYENKFREFLQSDNIKSDVFHMSRAYMHYPGAPRFQQLAAIVNALVNRCYKSVDNFLKISLL